MTGATDSADRPNDGFAPAEILPAGEHVDGGRAPARPAEAIPIGGPATFPGYAGGMPNFSGTDTDDRLMELWLRDKAVETKRQYVQDLEKFYDFTGGKTLSSVTLADLQEFAEFVSVLVAPATAARMLSTLKSLFSFANKTGYLPYNVGGALRLPAIKNVLPERIFTEAEVHRMVERTGNERDRVLRCKKAAKKAGLSEDVSPHWLRHSHATHAKRRGADLDLIMRTLRHASLSTTGRYLHADPSDSSAMYLGL